jgi:selenocysteine lyase/cysteine desulfurase
LPEFSGGTATVFDVDALRASEFPHLGRAPYLNAASLTPLPERSRLAGEAYNRRRSAIHELRGDDFEPTLARARAAAARLVNADAAEIALLPNTSHGVNLAAQCLPLQPGRRIVVSDLEFPANVYPWVGVAREGRARVDVVRGDALGRPDPERLLEELARGDVGILALSSVQFATGYAADLARLGEACRAQGTWFVVDAIQGLGCVPMDVRAAGIDVLASGGHKWLCSPFGTGFAYVRRELIAQMEPRVVGWTALTASADYTDCCDYRWELVDDARRFEVATQPLHDIAAFTASLELLLEVGIPAIHAHVLSLLDPLAEWLTGREGITIVSDLEPARRSGIFSFRTGDTTTASYKALRRAGIDCVMREGSIRIAPHFYNTAGEVAAVMDALEQGGW